MRNKWMLQIKPIAAFLLCFAMVLTFGGCKKDDPSVDKTSMTIAGADDAITHLAEAEADYGYENALSELTEISTHIIDGDTYYRFQQNYKGIPVYGKTIVCVVNDQGGLTSVSGNVMDVNSDINLDSTVNMDAVELTIRAYASETLGRKDVLSAAIEITLDQQYIFDGNTLANMYYVKFGGNILDAHKVLVDAHSAQVLNWESVFSDFLTNSERLEDANIRCDENTNHELSLMDQQRNITIFAVDQETVDRLQTIENIAADTSLIVTAYPDGEVSEGVEALVHTAQIHDFYSDVLNRQGYDGKTGPVYVYLCSEDMLADNAKGGAFPDYGTLFIGTAKDIFTEPISKALDILAHEYTHMVFKIEAGDTQDVHSESVNEAIADIFGNVIELHVNGQQDASWPLAEDAGYVKYNMADSVTMASYGESAHDNARILSHSAYLMWNGIDGTKTKRLSTTELAELWYRAVLMMPADCDFILCRQLVEVAAQSMETLNDEQRECVREAFDRVEIPSMRKDSFYPDYRLNKDATLTVYDQNNEPYNGYTLQINGTIDVSEIASNMIPDIGWVVNRTNTVEEPGAYALDLPQGRYMLTITDRYYDESYTIYVEISNDHTETNIDLITAYEEPLVVVIPEPDYEELVTDASIAAYLPFVEKAIAETAYDSATGSGFLYDMDSDGVDELVILNTYAEVGGNSFPGHAYSVYDIENGEVITECDKELLFYDAGGPSGYVGVVNYLGDKAFVVYLDNGETGYQAHRESLYTIYNPDNLQVIASASLDYVSADTVQVNNCTVNGNSCSYNDYLSVVDAIEPIMIADIYSNDETDGSMGLYELLRFIQELSGIKPEQSPQITKADAEKIANSVWDEYLKREQGFDWKIFKEESLIKEGVEYYCYTLQTNSKYGATDWSVFYYLFINSVTGEYSNSLYDGFSQIDTTDTSETEQVESTPEIDSDTITEQKLLGEWVIDTEYTMEFNDMSMWDFYGTSFSHGGNKMTFGSDGSYKYYVAWCYGNGTFELQNGEIAVNLTDGDPIQGAIKLLVMTDGVTRIALDQYGDGNLIFWIKS